jgi:hypothetical protein
MLFFCNKFTNFRMPDGQKWTEVAFEPPPPRCQTGCRLKNLILDDPFFLKGTPCTRCNAHTQHHSPARAPHLQESFPRQHVHE